MPDILSARERELINEALAAGRVTQVPRGVSGMPVEGVSWRDSGPAQMRQRFRAERIARAKAREEGENKNSAPTAVALPKREQIDARTDKRILAAEARLTAARAFAEGGRTVLEMAAHLGVSADHAARYCSKHKILLKPKPTTEARSASIAARDHIIRELAASGLSAREIAEKVGGSKYGVYSRAARIGVSFSSRRGPRKDEARQSKKRSREDVLAARRAVAADRRELVRSLAQQGKDASEIAKELKVSVRLVYRDVRDLSISLASSHKYHHGPTTAVLARWEQIRTAAAKGLTVAQIADQLGVKAALVRRDAARAGISVSRVRPSTEAARRVLCAKLATRREVLAGVFRPEMTRFELLQAMAEKGHEMKIGVLEQDMRALGLRTSRKGRNLNSSRAEDVRSDVEALLRTGLSVATVARRVGLSVGRIMKMQSTEAQHAA